MRADGLGVHAYVLMSERYHLLVETPQPNLVKGMHWFQCTYTAGFNRRHRLAGHLSQGRYKAVVVDPQECSYFDPLLDVYTVTGTRSLTGITGSDLETIADPAFQTIVQEADNGDFVLSEFTVDASIVPEPSTALFGAIGVLGLCSRRNRDDRNAYALQGFVF